MRPSRARSLADSWEEVLHRRQETRLLKATTSYCRAVLDGHSHPLSVGMNHGVLNPTDSHYRDVHHIGWTCTSPGSGSTPRQGGVGETLPRRRAPSRRTLSWLLNLP